MGACADPSCRDCATLRDAAKAHDARYPALLDLDRREQLDRIRAAAREQRRTERQLRRQVQVAARARLLGMVHGRGRR